MAIVIIFLISIIIVLLLRLLFVNKEIKNIVRQLEKIIIILRLEKDRYKFNK